MQKPLYLSWGGGEYLPLILRSRDHKRGEQGQCPEGREHRSLAERAGLRPPPLTMAVGRLVREESDSHFSRVRLCDPIDGSPLGSPVLGILQARTLEWVAISFSNA